MLWIENWLWLIVMLPFAGAALNLFFGRYIPRPVTALLACGSVLAAAVLSFLAFQAVRERGPMTLNLFEWIVVPGGFSVDMALAVDQLTAVMILVVTGVGFLIHVYSIGYMAEEKRYSRYFAFLNLFTGFMLLLVMGKNLLVMFIGWEGVGLCSYLLIGFWFEKTENAVAGMKAFIVNRIGDFGFTLGVLLLFFSVGNVAGVWTVDFDELKHALAGRGGAIGEEVLTLVGILLFVGACGKSAQIPLYVWLPDAMAGPTPVSALIHAATMVTAGVYMVARMNFLYTMAPAAMAVVAVVGALTALFAATIGTAQNDIKKVLAYSTVSQLGFMFLGVGVGAFAAGIFHLMTHAFFKACLFLGSGSVIHGTGGEQDIRKMGGLKKYMPWTYRTFLVATIAIAGIPPLAGFFSKDEILWGAFSGHAFAYPGLGKVLWGMGLIAAGFTAFYMFRLVFMTFGGEYRGHAGHGDHGAHHPHESPLSMVLPLVILALLAIAGGWIGIPAALGGGAAFEHWLSPVFGHGEAAAPTEHHYEVEWILMALSVLVALVGIGIAWTMYGRKSDLPERVAAKLRGLYNVVLNKYWIDEISQAVVVGSLVRINNFLARFDHVIIDGAVNGSARTTAGTSEVTGMFDNSVVDGGVNGTAASVKATGEQVRKMQTGNIREYLAVTLVGVLFVIVVFSLWFILSHR